MKRLYAFVAAACIGFTAAACIGGMAASPLPAPFLISANIPPPQGWDLPTTESFLTQNGATLYVHSTNWSNIEPTSGQYNLTDTIINPFTMLIPQYPFKGVVLIIKMIDSNTRTMPADLQAKAWNDPVVVQHFLAVLHGVAGAPGVAASTKYILLGNEVDSYFAAHSNELSAFMPLLKMSIDQLHHDLPGVKVGTITTFDSINNPQLFGTLTQFSDVIDYTYYPVAANWQMRPVTDAPSDIAKMVAAAGGRQFGYTEIGYTTAATSGSSPQAQANFASLVFQTLNNNRSKVAFVNWASLSDTPQDVCLAYATSQGIPNPATFCAYGTSMGLRTYDNRPKPAWSVFLQEVSTVNSWH